MMHLQIDYCPKGRTKHLLLFLFCTSFAFVLRAQELFFTPSKVFQNISSLETYHIFQDSKGYIWLSTDAGVSCYDGNKVTNYTTEDGLSENVVFRGCEDRKGRIWFCTLSGMFCYFENGKFNSIAANKVLPGYFKGAANNFFFIGENDTLFCGPIGTRGLFAIAPQNNYAKIVIHNNANEKALHRFIVTNKINPRESVMGFGGGYTIKSGLTAELDTTPFCLMWNDKKFIIPFHFKKIIGKTGGTAADFMGSSSNSGDTVYIPTGYELVQLKKNDTNMLHVQFPQTVLHIDQDKEGDLWVSVRRSGGFFYKNSNLKSKPIRFLNGLSLSSVLVDREGTIWATTLEKGVFVSTNKALITIKKQDDLIGTIQADSNRLGMMCSKKKFAFLYRKDSIRFDSINNPPQIEEISFFDVDKYFYIGTKGPVYYTNLNSKKGRQNFSLLSDVSPIHNVGGIKDIIRYNGDTLLILGWGSINLIYHDKLLKSYPIKESGINSTANFMTKLNDGTILFTPKSSGIFEFKNNKFIPFLPQLPQLKTRINFILEDKKQRLWVATETHLYCYDEYRHLFQFNKQNGLISNQINALTVDEDNNIWGASSLGLFKINNTDHLNKPLITHFNTQHGLPDLRIEKIAAFDHKIICLTNDYIFYFPTNKIHKNTTPPLVNISAIFINGKQLPYTDSLTTYHDENNILIQPTSSSYKSSEKKGFIYKLEPYDNEWHFSATQDIKYTNLDHGTYQLLIYALNNDLVKSEKPASLMLTIKPPFWYTWWFILTELIVAGLLGYYFLSIGRKRIERKEQEKAKVNQKIAEFKMTALRSQMNPHFIFNAIGSIQHFILQNEAKQSYNYLAKFSMLIRNILNNSREEYISLEQEIITLKLYIELEQIRFEEPFRFVIDIDEALDVEMDIPTMLIQPYVENSIWHGLMPKKSGGILELSFKKKNEALHVTIRDNGVGRKKKDVSNKHISKGMSITEQRIETLEATSQKKYKTFIVDLKDEQSNALGTEVNIIIPID